MSDSKSLIQDKTELVPANVAAVKSEVVTKEQQQFVLTVDDQKALETQADELVNRLVAVDPNAMPQKNESKAAVETMASELQKQAANFSKMLQQPIRNMADRSSDEGDVGNALVQLKMKVEDLDPAKFDFEPGWASKAVGWLPGIGTPLNKYFSKFESAQTVISAIINSLDQGKQQLIRDNVTLSEDQNRMHELSMKLDKTIKLAQILDQKLNYRLEREIPTTDPRHKFISEELIFPLRQRIIDLQQQLAVNMQGVLATELIIRNNKELARGVDRTLNVTVSALNVAAAVALALANQKIVLDKIEAVNKTTSDLIAGTAARLKTQGVQIQQQASSAQISIESLKSAFADLNSAMDQISQFRTKALPEMANSILELNKVTAEAGKAVERLGEGNRQADVLKIEVQ